MEQKMNKRIKKNYPLCSRKVQQAIKTKALKRINNFKPEFLVNKDERYARYAKPLSGYLTEKDLKRLDRVNQEIFVKPMTRDQVQQRIQKLRQMIKEEGRENTESSMQDTSQILANFKNKNVQASLRK